ncbi:hypothetical protein B0T25DRAFT_348979 [Lasiosphaeria hispida]|uniref:Uncharacterized protein n=1 Tax=Lasiosphaeria hispida TaxID=260671 RepID=A0AAJ0H6S2_9PEZI|nr:hypothetical protein B0T25DRAFT_348979 [Lasiosphaeria hispida]
MSPRSLSGDGLSFWADRQGQSGTAFEFWVFIAYMVPCTARILCRPPAPCRVLDFAICPSSGETDEIEAFAGSNSLLPIALSTPRRRWLCHLPGVYKPLTSQAGVEKAAPTEHPQEPQRIRPSPPPQHPQTHRPTHRPSRAQTPCSVHLSHGDHFDTGLPTPPTARRRRVLQCCSFRPVAWRAGNSKGQQSKCMNWIRSTTAAMTTAYRMLT